MTTRRVCYEYVCDRARLYVTCLENMHLEANALLRKRLRYRNVRSSVKSKVRHQGYYACPRKRIQGGFAKYLEMSI